MNKEVREPKQKRSIEKKEKIISAGYNLFLEKGYFNMTTADIAKAAGLSTGTVYAYFKDKKDILITCLSNTSGQIKQQIIKELNGISEETDLFNTVKNIINIVIQSHKPFSKKYHDELMSLSYVDEDIANFFDNVRTSMIDAVLNQLRKSGFELKHENEQSFLMYSILERLEDELVFDIYPDLNKEILIDECARVIVSMIQERWSNNASSH